MIKIVKHGPPEVPIFTPKGELIGVVTNEEEFVDIRAQIAEQELEGYYIIYKNEKFVIQKTGRITNYPNGLYDGVMDQTARLFRAQKVQLDKATK